jgi:hypothetical protein
MQDASNAPAGYEWKHVKLPRNQSVYPNRWRQCRFVTVDMHEAVVAVLVKQGEPGIRRLPCEGLET